MHTSPQSTQNKADSAWLIEPPSTIANSPAIASAIRHLQGSIRQLKSENNKLRTKLNDEWEQWKAEAAEFEVMYKDLLQAKK